MPDNNAYRKNIQDNNAPKQVSSWSYGGSSDSGVIPAREIYKKIYEVGQTDADRGAKLAVDFYKIQNTQGSPYYNPYSQATNQAVGKLSAMGINTSGMNTDWFKTNTDWQKDLVYSGTSNSPVTPPKKTATAQQNAAYQMWQLSKQAELTDKVDSEWAAMQQEIYYWTQRSDLNLSDDDIIAKVNENKQKNYPTLYALDKSRQPGQTLLELNHGTDYSEDNMYGVIWSARNGKSTGNVFNDNLMSAGGRGNTWQANDDISAKMDRGNLETYSPFSVGMTADDVGLYWGVTGIDDDMLKKIESQVDWNNQTDVDMFNKASEALATTKKAEEEKALLEESIKTWVKRGYSEETIQTKLEKLMAKSDFATLRKMDEDIQKREARNKMVQTAYAVDYRRQDVDNMIRDLIAERDNKPSAAKTMRDIVGGIGGLVTNPAGAIEQGVSDFFGTVKSIGDAITGAAQQPNGQQTVPTAPEAKPTEDAILTNAPAETQVAPSTQTTAPSYPVITDADIEQAAEKDRKIAGAVATIENNTTDDEKIVLQNAGSSMWNTARDFFSGAKADPAMSQAIATQSADTAKHSFFDTALANVDTIANYENTQANLANWEEQFAQYEAKWGDLSDYQKEFHTEFSKTVENNVEVFLTYDDEKKRYVVSNIVSPERGIVSMYDDIIPHSYDANSEAYRLMNVAEQVALQATEDANKVLTAQERVKAGGDNAAQEIAGYKALYAQIERAKEYLKKNEGDYKKSKNAFEDSYTSLGSVAAALGWLGDGNDNGINEMLTMTEFFSQYSKQPQLPASNETTLQRVNRLYGGEATDDQKAAYIKQEIAKIDDEIDKLNMALEWAEKNEYQLPDTYKKNIRYKLEDLAVQKKEAEYCQILTDTDPKELEAAIKAGKEFEEKHGYSDMGVWNETFGADRNDFEYYSTLRQKQQYDTEEGIDYADEDGNTQHIDIITDDDEKLYYYLLGRKVLELGDQFEERWAKNSVNDETKNLLTEIMKDSDDFVNFMENDDYGVWTSRKAEKTEKFAENMVDSGLAGGIYANIAGTLMTPIESISSALYTLDKAFGNERINPDTSARHISRFKESTRQATFQSIKDVYGEGTFAEKLASLGYEIYSNRGDSLMNSMVFGPIFGFSGKFADILNEFAGASPMGATAALNAAAHAVEQGASTDQAWLIAGITFLSETVTEAITYSNIRDAFGTTKELTGESLKSFLKEWLTESGVEEAFGESLNDILENAAQVWAEDNYSNGDYQSELTALMDKYIGEGMTEDEARIAAIQAQAQGVLHTALVSYLSAGTDVGIQAGKAALNTTNNYRTATRALQKIGIGNSMLDNMLNDWRRSRNGEQITTEEAVAEGEAPVVKAEEATEKEAPTEEQRETATDVVNIERSKGSDASTQSAAVASALNTSTKKNKTDHKADAAAAYLTRVFGENGSTIVQETLAGAAEAKVDVKAVKHAIKNAALGDGAATALVQSEAFQKAKPADKARMLVQTLQQDSFDQKVQSTINSRVQDFRKTRTISDLAANGHFDQAQADRAAAEKAAQNTQRVEQELDTQRGVQQAAADAVQQAKDMLLENAKDPQGVNAVTQAANKADKQATVVHEYEQSAAKARQDQQAAEEKADQSAADAMATAREAGDQQIAQEDQAEVEAEAQEQAAQQAAEEEQARLQAEEDEKTGKTQEDEDNAKIDAFVDSSSADEETKERVRKQLKERNQQRRLGKIDLSGRLSDAESMLALGALQRKLGVPILFSDTLGAADGEYNSTEGVIYLNKRKAQDGSMRLGQALVEVAMHEITHSLEQTKHYAQYRQIVLDTLFGKGENFDQAAYDLAIKQKQDQYKKNGTDLTPEGAEKEIIADFAKNRLSEKDIVQRFMDAGMGGKMRNMLHNINQALKNFFSNMSGADREAAENLRKAERAFQKALNERAKTEVHPGSEQFSIAQFAQATNMIYDEKTQTLKTSDGRIIDGVKNKVTPDMIKMTPVGKLINLGLSDEVYTGEDGKQHTQKNDALDMFAGLMNMVAMLKDNNLVWEIASGTLESTFSALKANSDTQYHDTIDFGTICAKTQAIVNVMSEVMLDRLKANDIARKEGRFDDVSYGLTRDDVLKIYNETHKAGLSVPCPVCYVFSHWMGVPSLLGQMSRFQHDYIVTGKDANGNDIHYGDGDIVMDQDGYATFDPAETERAALDYIEKMHGLYGDKEGVDTRKSKITSEINKGEKRHTKLAADIENYQNQLKNEDLKPRSREALEKKLAKAQADMEQNAINITALDEEMREVEAYNWITQSLMKQNENGEYVIDPDFRITPDEVLLDMRRTGEFSDRYAKNWAYRTSRGAGMGKSILPYSGASLGDIIMGSQTRVATTDNPLFTGTDEEAADAIEGARKRARRQNLIGGQRLQSTSDFRPEWGLDYVMAFLELQAANSNAQMYTKVAEAVDLFASAGADVNLSIMGSGNGFHEATAEELAQMTDEQKAAATVDGKVYVMDFSDVTGMKYSDALEKSKQYDNVQMILVGMNDTHIRLALAGDDIDFVIPWHSSGNSREVLSQLVASVEESLNTSSDYTNTQSDKFVSRKVKETDPVTGKKTTKTVDARTDEQKTMWNARIKILTGIAQKAVNAENPGKGGLTEAEKAYVLGDKANPYLRDLYNRFYVNEGDKCFGVALTASQAKQIFPYEYWQTDVTKPGGTKETADENGRRFIEYCQAMGVVPRFSGVWDAKNKKVKNGNFAGAVYDQNGKITGYDPSQMQKGYWKLLIDRKMYDLEGNYREQKQIDVSNIKIGDVEGKGKNAHLTKYNPETGEGSMLPTETSAKYGIPALERQAAEASERLIRKPFDLEGTQKLYSNDFTDAELDDMLRQADIDYEDAVQRGDMEAAQADVDRAAEQAFSNSKVRNPDGTLLKMYHGTKADFTEFRRDMIGQTGRFEGSGFNFTPFEGRASSYGENVLAGYLNIQNPLSAEKKTISIADLAALIRRADPTGDNIIADYARETRDYGSESFVRREAMTAARNIWNSSDNDVDIYSFISAADSDAEGLIAEFENLGYDGLIHYSDNGNIKTAIAFNSEQFKESNPVTYDDNGNVIPLSERFNDQNPDIRYSYEDTGHVTEAELDDMLRQAGVTTDTNEYGQIGEYGPELVTGKQLEGTNPNASTAQGPVVRAFGAEDGMLNSSDEIANFAKEVTLAQNTYFPDTNAEQIARAVNWIRTLKKTPTSDGFAEALQAVTADDFDYRSADGQARMVAVMGLAAAKNDVMAQAALADAFMRQGTDLGRALQARKLFKLMTPEGRIETLERTLKNAEKELNMKGTTINLKFSDWIYQAAAVAENDADFFRVQQAAYAELGKQIPASWRDRVRSIRMFSMLANPRTHIRNIVGNALFIPAVSIKNKLGAVGEIVTNEVRDIRHKEKYERTKTLAVRVDPEIREFTRQDAKTMRDTLTGEAKFSEATQIKKGQTKVGQFFDTLSDFNSNLLEGEDWFFLKGHYSRALGGWMQANGYTVEQVQNDPALLERGRAYAIQEAQKATYRDFSDTAAWLNEASRKGGFKGFLVDAALPFKKTPANILKRGIEYSPIGIVKGLTNDMYRMKQYNDYQKGKLKALPAKALSPTQVVDHICSGLSGTMVMALGYLLAGTGAVSCGFDDDDKDRLEKLKGGQEYALNLGKAANDILGSIGIPKLFGEDVTFTMDWAAPMSMPFFVGASLRNQLEDAGYTNVDEVLKAVSNIAEPVFNLSMLDGINTLFRTSSYDNDNPAITQIGGKILSNYVTSYVPSVLGAITRTFFDDTRRKSFVESGQGNGIPGSFRYAIEQSENKIPGLSTSNIPYRDVWGNAETAGFAERLFENFILPGYVNNYNNDPVVNELGRLYDSTGDSAMIPEEAKKSVQYKNVTYRLSAEDYDKLVVTRGKAAYDGLTKLMNSSAYKNATDEEQKEQVKKVWNYADQLGKAAVIPNYEVTLSGVDEAASKGTSSYYEGLMITSLNAGDYKAYDTCIQALHDNNVEDSTIKTKLGNTYREKYKTAYRKNDYATMLDIEDMLDHTGFDFDYQKWQDDVDEKG